MASVTIHVAPAAVERRAGYGLVVVGGVWGHAWWQIVVACARCRRQTFRPPRPREARNVCLGCGGELHWTPGIVAA